MSKEIQEAIDYLEPTKKHPKCATALRALKTMKWIKELHFENQYTEIKTEDILQHFKAGE